MPIYLENCHWEFNPDGHFGTDSEIQVWKIPVKEFDEKNAEILSPPEKKRILDCKNKPMRNILFSSRIALRTLIARHLNMAAETIQIATHDKGKPYLANEGKNLEFNLSHSGELILLALSNSLSVGIDVELNKPVRNWLGISNKVFDKSVVESLVSNPAPENHFLKYWTMFEASQKLSGMGIFNHHQNHQELKKNAVETIIFEPARGYTAALAFDRHNELPEIHFYQSE